MLLLMLALLAVFGHMARFCCLSPQGSPGLPSLAALHSNQILTVKVCLVDFSAAAAAAATAPLGPTLRRTNQNPSHDPGR